VNFNNYGYVLTQNSPATDASYTVNPAYPNWIWDVWYEVTVKPSAFGTAGFGYPRLTDMHASPSKTGSHSEPLTVSECGAPPPPPPPPPPPVVPPVAASTVCATPTTFNPIANATYADPEALQVTSVSAPGHGTAVLNGDGTITYTPAVNCTSDSFTYTVADDQSRTVTGQVTVTVTNQAPIGADDAATITSPATSVDINVLANDTDPEGKAITASAVSTPAHGTATILSNGQIRYTATSGFTGSDTFTYTLRDLCGGTAVVRVNITTTAHTSPVSTGDTATIGFWQNKNGQALIKAVNGGPTATNLGNWLATSFPYLYGSGAGAANNLTGKTNTQVAAYYVTLFKSNKTMAQVMGNAFAMYVTSSALSGANVSGGYGFTVSASGTGVKTYNVGSNGAAIGLANNTAYTVAQIMAQANLRMQQGTFNANAFNVICEDINSTGDIK
jgi:hypothetical protein